MDRTEQEDAGEEEVKNAATVGEEKKTDEGTSGKVMTPKAPARKSQVIVIDGESITYEKSLTWEC